MTVLTLHIPDELSAQADKIGLLNEHAILQAFREFLEKKPKERELGGAEGMVKFMADDFNEPMDEFSDYYQ